MDPRLEQLERDPNFVSLPYSKQVEYRFKLGQKVMNENPDFDSIPPDKKLSALQRYAFRPPVFENKRIEADVLAKAQRIQGGDEKAIREVQADWGFAYSALQEMTILKWLWKALIDPVERTVFPSRGAPGGYTRYEANFGSDARKAKEYFTTLLSQDAKRDKLRRFLETSGKIFGTLEDFATFFVATGGNLPAKMFASGMEKVAATSTSKFIQSRVGQYLVKTAAPLAFEASTEGVFEVGRDLIKQALPEGYDQRVEMNAAAIARSFGTGAAYDYVFNTAASILLPFGRNVVKNIRGYKSSSEAIAAAKKAAEAGGEAAEEAWQQMLSNAASARDIPDRALALAPEHVQDKVLHIRKLDALTPYLDTVTPGSEPAAFLNSWGMGYSLRRVEDGYRLRKFESPGEVEVFKTLGELNTGLSKHFLEYIDDLDNLRKIVALGGHNAYLLNIRGPAKYLDNIYSPELHLTKEATEDLRDLHNRIRRGDYVPLSSRQYGTAEELGSAANRLRKEGGRVENVFLDLEDADAELLSRGGRIEEAVKKYSEIDITKKSNPNASIFLRNTANFDELQGAAAIAARKGIDATDELRVAGYDSVWLDTEKTKVMLLHEEGLKFFTDGVDAKTGRWVGSTAVPKASDTSSIRFSDKLYISSRMKVKLPTDTVAGDEEVLSSILSSGLQGGVVDAGRVKRFSQAFLSRFEGKVPDINDIEIRKAAQEAGFVFRLEKSGDKLILRIPEKLTTPEAERNFVTSLIDTLGDYGSSRGKAIRRIVTGSDFSKTYQKVLKEKKVYTTMWGSEVVAGRWVSKVAGEELGATIRRNANGMLEVVGKDSSILGTYGSFEEMATDVISNSISPSELKTLAKTHGFQLIPRGEGKYGLRRVTAAGDKSITVEADSIPELISKAGLEVKVPSRFLPRYVVVEDGVTTLDFNGEVAVAGDIGKAYRLLEKFEDQNINAIRRIVHLDKGDIYKAVDSQKFRIYDERLKHWFEANTFAEAKHILNNSIEDTKILLKAAHEKGIDVRVNGSGYDVIDEVGNYHYAATKQELESILQNRPLPTSAPELIDVDDELKDILNELPGPGKGFFKPFDFSGKRGVELGPLSRFFSGYLLPKDVGIPHWAKKTGNDLLMEGYLEAERGMRIMRPSVNHVQNLIYNTLSTPHGKVRKLLPAERQEALYHFITAKGDEIDAVRKKFNITPDEERIRDDIRTILGKTPKEGLFARFAENPADFLFDYLPQLRKGIKKLSKAELDSMSHLEIAKKIFSSRGKVPESIKFWALEERLNVLLDMSVDTNLYSILTKYNVIGHKRLFLNEAWGKMRKSVMGSEVSPLLRMNVQRYMEGAMGIPPTVGIKEMRKISEDIWTKLGGNKHLDSGRKNDLISTMFSLNYTTTMGWKPFMWFRNMFQIYTVLAPRFGNDWVHKAIRDAVDIGENTFQHLEQIGVVLGKDDLPLFGDIATRDSFLGKLMRKGLKRYKNSDDFTRVVAYLTVKNQWDDAVGALQRKVIDAEQFKVRSGLNLLGPERSNKILQLVEEGKWNAALDEYGAVVVNETMFPYRSELKPELLSGTFVGRMFGRYGTYPMYYVSNILKGFKYGTKAQKAAFAARWLANSLAIYGAFSAVGINADEFLPWTPMFFSGGPEFNLMIDMMRAMGGGYRGRQAWEEVKKAYKMFIPGSYQARAVARAIRYMEEGDYWKATLALTGAPLKP
jgi:hypothetical protein